MIFSCFYFIPVFAPQILYFVAYYRCFLRLYFVLYVQRFEHFVKALINAF